MGKEEKEPAVDDPPPKRRRVQLQTRTPHPDEGPAPRRSERRGAHDSGEAGMMGRESAREGAAVLRHVSEGREGSCWERGGGRSGSSGGTGGRRVSDWRGCSL